MKKKLIVAIFFGFLFLCIPSKALAKFDPLVVSNNHFGMHIVDANNLQDIAGLVNSNGGDWGYVTLVIQKGERDTKRWQKAFDEMRRLHLIPIIRIASAPKGEVWEKLNKDEIDGWVGFLNSLNWVIENRYITVGNEPNHAKEWGGEVNPEEYAHFLKEFSEKLKKSNDNFFIMPAGFDASAPTSKKLTGQAATMNEDEYLKKMLETDTTVFDYIDGWSSHSYPNPGFSGPGDGTGKGSVSSFKWELEYLKSLGVNKNFPVFITETGWSHKTDSLTTDIGRKIETAFKGVWSDERVVAVTPFIFKYTQAPFDTFSFINEKGERYDFYENVLNLPKIKGNPVQEEKGDILTGIIPKIASAKSTYRGIFFIKNTGQAIWEVKDLGAVDNEGNRLTIESMHPSKIEPQEIGVFLMNGVFPNESENRDVTINLISNGRVISNAFVENVTIIPKLPNFKDVIEYIKIIILRKLSL